MRKKKSLKGLDGIYVVVEDLGPEVKGAVTRRQLRENVEARLQMAGIRILKEKEAAKTIGKPYLYVNVGALPMGEKRFACRVDIEFHQLVTLIGDSSKGHAITWDEGIIAVGDINTIYDHVNDLVFDFIYDYLAVNPSRRKPKSPKSVTPKRGPSSSPWKP